MAFTPITAGQVDADSPVDSVLMGLIKTNLDDLDTRVDDLDIRVDITSIKTGSFTRDTATASGNQAVTGVGFLPSAVIFFANQAGSSETSWGMDDGSTPRSVYDDNPTSGGTYTSVNQSILLQQGSGNHYDGVVTSLDADGFTIAWTKVSAPTGTVTVNYLAIG
jgi:hypothetical protein